MILREDPRRRGPRRWWCGSRGTRPTWVWRSAPRTRLSPDPVSLLATFVDDGPPVVMDNGSIRFSRETEAALPGLASRGLTTFRLPACSPEPNAIERVFRTPKHHHAPARTYLTPDDVEAVASLGVA